MNKVALPGIFYILYSYFFKGRIWQLKSLNLSLSSFSESSHHLLSKFDRDLATSLALCMMSNQDQSLKDNVLTRLEIFWISVDMDAVLIKFCQMPMTR